MKEKSKYNIVLPIALEGFRERLEATIKPYIEIQIQLAVDATLWESKFLGLPYLPITSNYPKTPQGECLYLLAQINFAEVPELEGFPKEGILQFYIAEDGMYGKNFDDQTNQAGFRVLYFREIEMNDSNLITDFSFLPSLWERSIYDIPIGYCVSEQNSFPAPNDCLSLKFMEKYAPIIACDYQAKELIGSDFLAYPDDDADESVEEEFEQIHNEYYQTISRSPQLGGYPFFSQDDPRSSLPIEDEPYILLLQINSCGTKEIGFMWGDVGVCNFFIKRSSLERLDFSEVLYNWDCG
jgi:uncharacterized protein YwqG